VNEESEGEISDKGRGDFQIGHTWKVSLKATALTLLLKEIGANQEEYENARNNSTCSFHCACLWVVDVSSSRTKARRSRSLWIEEAH
jgi:hypothetical protein